MKKIVILIALLIGILGCGSKKTNDNKIRISATSSPHAEVLEQVKPILKDKYDIDLEINIIEDYYIPNKALDGKEIDANYFQHIPFLEQQVKEHKYDIQVLGDVHIEPIGIYSKKYKNIKDIKKGSTIILSNSVSDHGRILALLEKAGLIKIDPNVKVISAEVKDIVENKLNLVFKADIDPSLLVRSYENNEADLVAINANYALTGKLNPAKDPIIIESSENNPYVNVIVIRKGDKDSEKLSKLLSVLKSDVIKEYINKQYKGAVIPTE